MKRLQLSIIRLIEGQDRLWAHARYLVLGVIAVLALDCVAVVLPLLALVHLVLLIGIPLVLSLLLYDTVRRAAPLEVLHSGELFLVPFVGHSVLFYGCLFAITDRWSVLVTVQVVFIAAFSVIWVRIGDFHGAVTSMVTKVAALLLVIALPIYLVELGVATNVALLIVVGTEATAGAMYWLVARTIPRNWNSVQQILDYEDPQRPANLAETKELCRLVNEYRRDLERLQDEKGSLQLLAEQFRMAQSNLTHPAALVSAEWGEKRERLKRTIHDEVILEQALDRLDADYSDRFFEELYRSARPFATSPEHV